MNDSIKESLYAGLFVGGVVFLYEIFKSYNNSEHPPGKQPGPEPLLYKQTFEESKMAENKCAGCDTPIPQGGTACPMCGAKVNPSTMAVSISPPPKQSPIIQTVTEVHHHHNVNQAQPILIEATSKKWKKMYLQAMLFLCVGVTSCVAAVKSEPPSGGMMTFASICWLMGIIIYIRARFGAWWHHG